MKYAEIGCISSGTLRSQDLAEALADELDYQLGRQSKGYPRRTNRRLINEARRELNKDEPDADTLDYCVEELSDALNEFAPPHCYFGASSGDPADYGFWVADHLDTEFDGLKVDDTSEVPADYRGEVLHVNDHGNMTLYVKTSRNRMVEIWACV